MRGLDCAKDSNKIVQTESTENVFTINNSNSTLDVTRRDPESQSSGKRHSILWTLAIDLPLVVFVVAIVVVIETTSLIDVKRGFYCNDPALSYKFTGDTISNTLLIVVGFVGDLPFILITELLFVKSQYSLSRLKHALKNTLWIHRSYVYGLFFNLIIFEVMKSVTGISRPLFFEMCQPDTGKTCNGSEYVTTFTCTSDYSDFDKHDSYRSFPSGHTSISVNFAIFVSWYLQRRAFDWRHRITFLVPVLQMACVTFAAIASLSRITDNKHHWWDVVVGAVHGSVCALYSIYALCNNFTRIKREEDKLSHTSTPLYENRTRHF